MTQSFPHSIPYIACLVLSRNVGKIWEDIWEDMGGDSMERSIGSGCPPPRCQRARSQPRGLDAAPPERSCFLLLHISRPCSHRMVQVGCLTSFLHSFISASCNMFKRLHDSVRQSCPGPWPLWWWWLLVIAALSWMIPEGIVRPSAEIFHWLVLSQNSSEAEKIPNSWNETVFSTKNDRLLRTPHIWYSPCSSLMKYISHWWFDEE